MDVRDIYIELLDEGQEFHDGALATTDGRLESRLIAERLAYAWLRYAWRTS